LSGGRRREYELLTRLAQRFRIHLCAVTITPEQDQSHLQDLRAHTWRILLFSGRAPADIGDTELQTTAAQVARNRSDAATACVCELLKTRTVQLIHAEGFYMMQHVPEATVPVVLVEQNIEYLLWEQRANLCPPGAEKDAAVRQMELTRRDEERAWARSSLCVALTEHDRRRIETIVPRKKTGIVPDGCDHRIEARLPGVQHMPSVLNGRRSILYVGNFDYAPNVDACRHYCDHIHPLVRRDIPDAHAWFVGHGIKRAAAAISTSAGVTLIGPVPDLAPWFDMAQLFVCPLRIGGGIQIKLLEALRRGRAIVTTSVGAQGFTPEFRQCFLVEDEPAAFARSVISVLQDDALRTAMQARSLEAARHLPTWDDAADQLMACYEKVLRPDPDSSCVPLQAQ
jgi:glycosyltransferase involved in cell wall biosynthesis